MRKEDKCENSRYSTSSPASAAFRLALKGLASLRRWFFARLTNFVDWFCIGAGLAVGLKVTFAILGGL